MEDSFGSMMDKLHHDMFVWDQSDTRSFLDINSHSRVFEKWLRHDLIFRTDEYRGSIIKPLNTYVQNLYPAPILKSIDNNKVILQQRNHAEIFLLMEEDGLYHTDRPWIRQYYKSNRDCVTPQNCFDGVYRFYMPWFLDEDILANIKNPDEDSPFFIYETKILFGKHQESERFIEPPLIDFHFKSAGTHMIDPDFGKISRLSPMFNIEFEADDIIVERVRNFYAKD
jgi:hypothetical protein